MKHVLVITFSNLKTDSRVRRHINFLKKKYKVTVACFEADATTEYDLILLKSETLTLPRKVKLAALLGLRMFNPAYQTQHPYFLLADKITGKLDLIIANDVETLPLAFHIAEKQNCEVIFDAHEYAPRHFEDKLVWRLFFQPLNIFLCQKYIPRVKAMITVGKGLANEYEKNFNVRPVIVTNAAYYHDIEPSPIKENSVRLVHHGIATPSRKLELMIGMMDHLDERFTLDMYLVSFNFVSAKTQNYPARLKELAAKNPRIRILDPIKSELIVRTINAYDMGVFLIPPVNFNYENTLPNKLFDFIQARLAIAIGPTPEMAEIVKHYDLGIVSENFTAESLAEAIKAITTEKLISYKNNSSVAAKELNAEENEKILIAVVEKSLNE